MLWILQKPCAANCGGVYGMILFVCPILCANSRPFNLPCSMRSRSSLKTSPKSVKNAPSITRLCVQSYGGISHVPLPCLLILLRLAIRLCTSIAPLFTT